MGRILGAATAALLLATGVSAQTSALRDSAVPPGIDRALWCASAFYWLAGSAEDSGDSSEAEIYDGWSSRLLEMAAEAMTSIDLPPEEIERLIAAYDQRALEELGTNTAPYDVAMCPDLLGDEGEPEAAGQQDAVTPETATETPAQP